MKVMLECHDGHKQRSPKEQSSPNAKIYRHIRDAANFTLDPCCPITLYCLPSFACSCPRLGMQKMRWRQALAALGGLHEGARGSCPHHDQPTGQRTDDQLTGSFWHMLRHRIFLHILCLIACL